MVVGRGIADVETNASLGREFDGIAQQIRDNLPQSGSVSLNDSANFFNDFNQQFIPGSTLTFTIDSTLIAPPLGNSPDNFSVVIFESYDLVNGYNPIMGTGGIPIPTTDPSGNDTVFNLDINGPGSTNLVTYSLASVPEPSSAMIMLFGVIGVSGAMCWRRTGARQTRALS